MEIRKAVITAGGPQRHLPLQSLVDQDGRTKTALSVLIDEVVSAGIDSIGVVISPGDEAAYAGAAGTRASRLTFIVQEEARGYAHAVHCAGAFTGSEPFLLLVSDHLCLSRGTKRCAQQLVEIARTEACSVSAVQATHESKLPNYGAVGGHLVNAAMRLYEVDCVLEKPTPTEAEQKIIVPGLRAGYYLCFFGMHVLTPGIHAHLGNLPGGESGSRQTLRDALSRLAVQERYLACELDGIRFDIGDKYGLLNAQLALALAGVDRDEVLGHLVEVLATSRN